MEILLPLIAGFLLLWKGGDLLVEGADAFARSHGVPSTLAGVFILGFGTSMPELAVSTLAAASGHGDLAVGNVVGSNIANVGLILGLAAVLTRLRVNRFLFRVEMPVCLAASVLGMVLLADGRVDRTDGLLLLAAFGIYAGFAVGTVRHRDVDSEEPPPRRPWFDLGRTVFALAAVVGGAQLFKNGAVRAAEALGVSQGIIGLTLVALGTSLPELATVLAAARARKSDLVVGNIIGSNIFNLLLVLGVAAVLADQSVEPRMPRIDVPCMLALAALPMLLAGLGGHVLGRKSGVLFLLIYASYIASTALWH